jgi:hypothetical protein
MSDKLPAGLGVEPCKWMEEQLVGVVEQLPDSGYPH